MICKTSPCLYWFLSDIHKNHPDSHWYSGLWNSDPLMRYIQSDLPAQHASPLPGSAAYARRPSLPLPLNPQLSSILCSHSEAYTADALLSHFYL